MKYWYAPLFISESGTSQPGIQPDGEDIQAPTTAYVMGTKAIHYDVDNLIVVVLSSGPKDGWEQKTVDEINSDYPGVL